MATSFPSTSSTTVPTSSTTVRAPFELALRSLDGGWDRARWEILPADGNRYEVVDGVLYMTTAPSVFHQWIVKRLHLLLDRQIDETGIGFTLFSPIGVFMPGCDPVQPDVVVIRAADRHVFQDGRIAGVPALLVEVQSPGNPTYDSRVKREAYARAGVPEYWMVRPASRDVLVCTQPDQALGDYGQSQIAGAAAELVSPTLPVRFSVATLFAGAPDTAL